MPRRSLETEATQELIEEIKGLREQSGKERPMPMLGTEEYTPGEYRDKFWGNPRFRQKELESVGMDEVRRRLGL